jgi:hypothetical protein
MRLQMKFQVATRKDSRHSLQLGKRGEKGLTSDIVDWKIVDWKNWMNHSTHPIQIDHMHQKLPPMRLPIHFNNEFISTLPAEMTTKKNHKTSILTWIDF